MTWSCKISSHSGEFGVLLLVKESDLNVSREILPSSLWRVCQPEFGCVHVCDLSSINWANLWLKAVDLTQRAEKYLLISSFMAQPWLLSGFCAHRSSFVSFCSCTSSCKYWRSSTKKLTFYLKQIKYGEDVKDTEHLKWNRWRICCIWPATEARRRTIGFRDRLQEACKRGSVFDSGFILKTKHKPEAATHRHGLTTVKSVHVHADLGIEPEAIMMRVDDRKCDAKALFVKLWCHHGSRRSRELWERRGFSLSV